MATSHEPYRLYRVDESYYSGKIEAYLRYKGIPFELHTMTARNGVDEVFRHTGMQKVPAVRTADGLWLTDSTLMIAWFEQQYSQCPVIPGDEATAFLALLLEDYADEWCWRSAMYYRWRDEQNANYMGHRIAGELLGDIPLPASWKARYFKRRQRRIYLYGDGLSANTEAAIADQFFSLSGALEAVLEQQPFLSGAQPGVTDFGFMGPYFRHYFCDPWPAKLMRDHFPRLTAWVTRVWAARGGQAEVRWCDYRAQAWQPVWAELVRDYLPYLHANHRAWQRGDKLQDCRMGDALLRDVPVVHYRVYCLEQLVQRYRALPAEARTEVTAFLGEFGPVELDVPVESGLAAAYELPLQPNPRQVSAAHRRKLRLRGTPWDRLS